ncbi:MAG: hypothetical protein Q8O67_20350 [Deltaproteobacteria bacterium]|nr:hypothetical protein [Deltaproteobacteria bacterium]
MTTSRANSGRPQELVAGPSGLALISLLLLFIGARMLEDETQTIALVLGTLASIAAAVWRVVGLPNDGGVRALRLRAVAAHAAVAAGGLLVTLSTLTTLDDDVYAIVTSLALLGTIGGGVVLFALEMLMDQSRASGFVDAARVERATSTAVTLVAGFGMLAGVVYAVNKQDVRFDLAYASPTSPSGATLTLLDTAACGDAKEKPEVFLFFERGSTSLSEVQDYFATLEQKGARVVTLDQAMDPALSKAIKVTKNGYVGFRCGEKTETWLLGAERDDAQKKLQKLDEEVRTRLGKISRDPVNVYMTVGHGERPVDESDKSGRAAAKSLKKLLESQNVKPKKLGVADGLTSAVPADAGLVVVLGPQRAFMPEEARTLAQYVDAGGAIALFIDPPVPGTTDPDVVGVTASLQPVFDALSVKLAGFEVVNDKEFVKESRTKADTTFVFSTSFGSHKAVKTLNSARGKAALLFLQAQAVSRVDVAAGAEKNKDLKVSMVARSRPATWTDVDGDRTFTEGKEKRDIVDLVAVIEKKVGNEKEARALVAGDSDVVADTLLGNEANAVFAYEAFQWLLRDDQGADAGSITVSDDVPIRHTRDEDTAWFYGTILAGPAVVLAIGLGSLKLRRRKKKPTTTTTTTTTKEIP